MINVSLSNLSIYYIWKNIKKLYQNNKFKISAPTWNEEFELPDGSYSVSDIQDYFEYVIKKHEAVTDNPSIRIYGNKITKKVKMKKLYCVNCGEYRKYENPEISYILEKKH